jgi:hypothetical protein
MLWVDVAECRIGFSGRLVVVHLILNVPERGVQTQVPFAIVNRLGEKPRGAVELTLQVQRHCLGKRLVGPLLALDIGDGRHSRRHRHPVSLASAYIFHGSLLQVLKNRDFLLARRYGRPIHTADNVVP